VLQIEQFDVELFYEQLPSAATQQEKRLSAYLETLGQAAGHADRIEPFKFYCKGLLLPGDRKSVEPLAARLAPDNVRRMHQSLHHLVADAPWMDEDVLAQVRSAVLPAMQKQGPVVAWVVDDTGFPRKASIQSVSLANTVVRSATGKLSSSRKPVYRDVEGKPSDRLPFVSARRLDQ